MKLEKLYGDVTDLESLKFSNFDLVFHAAGLVAYKAKDRPAMERVNVDGTRNIIAACEKFKIKRLIHISSVVAIGAGFSQDQILNEDSEFNIGHLNLGYFETKRLAEALVKDAVKAGKIDAVILNPSTMYGAGDAKKGSRKTQIKVACGKFKFYPPGGVNIVGVEDCVDAIIGSVKKGKSGERYILSGDNLLIKEVFDIIAEAGGVKPPPIALPEWVVKSMGFIGETVNNLGGPETFSMENAHVATMYHWFDNTKAKRELGFSPKPGKFAVQKSVQWMKENGYLSG
jgi:dihydroflavonol-4-reductase